MRRQPRPFSDLRKPTRFRRGRSLRVAFGLVALGVAAAGSGSAAQGLTDRVRDADDYYAGRQNPENLTKALELLRADVAQDPDDYEAWWRISKMIAFQARHVTGSDKMKMLDEGIDAGKKAVTLAPNRAEGHYWLGVNYDLTGEAHGYLRGLLWIDSIRKEMEMANKLDPDYEQAGAKRTLARIYYRAPFFKGGDKRRSMQMLKDCLARFPDDSLAMLYLSDSYIALGLRDDARKDLDQILSLCPDPQYAPELAENQEEARTRLAKFFHASQ